MKTLFLLIILLALCVWLYSVYVRVIKSSNAVKEAASGIEVQQRKRYDLIPNILTIAGKFMEHEKNLITEITNIRTMAMEAKAGSQAAMSANAKLDNLIGQLKVSLENYPQLKSDATMVQAMQTYNEVEEHIAASRRFYNSALTELRNTTQIFPGTLFAGLVSDQLTSVYYHTSDETKAPVNAADYLK